MQTPSPTIILSVCGAVTVHRKGNMEGSNNATFYIAPAQTAPRSPFAKSHARDAVCWSNANLSDKSLVKDDSDPAQECDAKPHHATSAAATPFAAALRSRSGRFRQSFRRTKRRVVQQLLVKMHSTEPSDDAEYAALRDRQLDLHEHLAAVAMHIKSFATNLVALGHGASLIGSASLQIASTGHTATACVPLHPSGPKAVMPTAYDVEFPKSMANVESHARSLAGVVLTTIVASLEKKMDTMRAIKREMDVRANCKLDYDSAVRKLRAAKQRGKADAIVRRDVKLQAARGALVSATDALVKKFVYYENARSVFIYHELRQFRELQTQFFRGCASSFETHEHHEGVQRENGDREPIEQLRTQLQKKLSLTNQGS